MSGSSTSTTSRRRGVLRAALAGVATLGLCATLAGSAAAAAPTGLEGIPRFDHIVVLPLENEDASTSFGPGSPATYLNSLRSRGTFLPNYYGTSHVSLGNYITMVSGLPANPATTSDCLSQNLYQCVASVTAQSPPSPRHLGSQLDTAGLAWAGYMDGTSTDCFHASYSPTAVPPDPYQGDSQVAPGFDYADRHNPWIYMADVIGDDARCQAHVHPYTALAGALATDTLPAFSFVTPDTCHDGHDTPCAAKVGASPAEAATRAAGGLTAADAWLQAELPALLTYLEAHNGLLVLNFDEGNPATTGQETCSACAGGGLGGRTGAILIGAGVPAGATVTTGYDHASLLRTVEDSFGITEHLGLAASPTAAPMTAVFTGPSPVVPELPLTVLAPLAAAAVLGATVLVRRRRHPG